MAERSEDELLLCGLCGSSDAKRFALGAVALAVLVLTIVPLPAAARGMMLDCPYL